jgi:hypothetical protein
MQPWRLNEPERASLDAQSFLASSFGDGSGRKKLVIRRQNIPIPAPAAATPPTIAERIIEPVPGSIYAYALCVDANITRTEIAMNVDHFTIYCLQNKL